jgi:hypothetical protein
MRIRAYQDNKFETGNIKAYKSESRAVKNKDQAHQT